MWLIKSNSVDFTYDKQFYAQCKVRIYFCCIEMPMFNARCYEQGFLQKESMVLLHAT